MDRVEVLSGFRKSGQSVQLVGSISAGRLRHERIRWAGRDSAGLGVPWAKGAGQAEDH